MRFAVAYPHPFIQVMFALILLTLIAFAMEGCPTLAKEKYYENHKTTTQIRRGSPLEQIHQCIEQESFDLLVLGFSHPSFND